MPQSRDVEAIDCSPSLEVRFRGERLALAELATLIRSGEASVSGPVEKSLIATTPARRNSAHARPRRRGCAARPHGVLGGDGPDGTLAVGTQALAPPHTGMVKSPSTMPS